VPEGIFILSIDINERKTAEEELLLRSEIMENMEDGVSLVQVSDGNFVYTNPKFDQIFGFEEDELIGTNVAELTAPTEDESPEEVAKKIIGSLHDDGVWSGEMLHSKKDGTVFWGYANISIFKHYEYGEVFLGVHTDITERKELQEELIDSKEFTESIIDSMADGLAVVDSNGVHLDVNQALCQMTGYSPEELIGTGPPHPYWPQEEYEKIQNSFEKIMNGNVNEIEIIFKKKNGARFPVILSPSILTDEKGNLTNAYAIIKDITERKRMEEIIRDNEARLSLALDAATMGVWDWDIVNNTTIRTLEHDKIFGYDSLLPEWNVENLVEHIIPEDREQIQKLITNPGGQNFFNFQCRIKRTDDQIRWIQVDGKVFHDKNNKPIRILGVVRDITDFKDIENELRASEEKYHTLFDKNPEYTILLGLDGTIQDVNLAAQQIVGNTAKELIGKHFTEIGIFPPDDLQKFMKKYKFHSEDDSQSYEMKIIDKNGQTRWTNVTTTIIEKLGKPNNILIISSDITERKKAENKIKESLIEKETLLKEIHHRVKNNMQIITSMLNLQTDYIQDTNTKDILIESRNRVKSMAMIHEKLYLSSDLSHINFRDYVRNLVSDIFYSYTIQLGTIDLVFDIEDVELNMETAMPLGLIINEIVTNSLKFAFPENIGSVIIKMKSQNGSFNLVIADDGIGLPDDFDFEKPKSLGLQLVKSLVEQIDGEIEVDNSNGTCYKINFKELLYKKRI
jgi:PAS domain S-box-containing protein